jgi:3-oxoacyl-[acyl-carrier protein] reductase
MDLGLKGKRALLLASSRGLGYASAHALAAEGAEVAISGSNLDRVTAAAERIASETGVKARGLLGDVSDPDNMNALAAQAEAALGGPVDILVNNSGGPPVGPALEMKEEDLLTHFTRMVVSVTRITGLLVPGMVDRKWGRVLTISTSGVVQPIPNMVLSNTLRGATVNYMKTLANEVMKAGVTVNVLVPASILTDRTIETNTANAARRGITLEQMTREREQGLLGGRYGSPEDFGAMVAFLCGRNAGYCTGSVWRVEGGNIKSIV